LNPAAEISTPVFNADSAYNFVLQQVEFGPRVPETDAHKACANFLINKMKKFADNVITQKAIVKAYDDKMLGMINIIGEFNPGKKNRIMFCAHWDTRPFADQDDKDSDKPIDGANDGASGVGVLLELARQLSKNKPSIGVDVIFFDTEDYGQPDGSKRVFRVNTWCLGSQYWAKNLHRNNYFPRYGILLDMVGASDAIFTMEGNSMKYAPGVMRKVWKIATNQGFSKYFSFDKTNAIVDDHVYINEISGIPCIDIVHYDFTTPSHFGKFWHTHDDNMEIIDKNTLRAVGQTLLEVIFQENNAS